MARPIIDAPKPKDPKVTLKEHQEIFNKIPDDELKKMQGEFLAATFDSKPKEEKKEPPKEEPKPEEKPKEEAKDKKEPEKPKDEPKPEEAPKEPVAIKNASNSLVDDEKGHPEGEPEQALDPLDDQEPLEDRVARLEAGKDQPKPKESTVEPDNSALELTSEDEDRLKAAAWLSKNDKRFQGRDLAKETKTWWAKEEVYKARWEKDNPGEEFDPGKPEHRGFYDKAPVTARDLDIGARGLIREEAADEAEKRFEKKYTEEIAPEIQEMRLRERLREEKPKIQQARRKALADLAVMAVPEFKEIINGDHITAEVYEKLKTANPVAVQFLDDESEVLKAHIEELETLSRLSDVVALNRDKEVKTNRGIIRPVADIAAAGVELERRIMSQPEKDQLWNGKRFVPRAALHTRIDSIAKGAGSADDKRAKIKALTSKFWVVETGHIRDFMVTEASKRVKSVLSRIPSTEKKQDKKDEQVPSTEKARTTDKPKEAAPPSSASSSDNVNTDLTKKNQSQIVYENNYNALWK